MRYLTVPILLCADAALAHAPDGNASFAEASRHLLLGDHHLALTILAMAAVAAAVFSLIGRRRGGSQTGRGSRNRRPADRRGNGQP